MFKCSSRKKLNVEQLSAVSDKIDSRGEWEKSKFFILSCIAMSVGLGNLWRFPYKALENGGGAFLFPYLFMLIFLGRPGYFLEMIMGQYSSKSSVRVFDCVPALRGVGIGQVLSMFTVSCFYATIMAISLKYFIHSLIGLFTGDLPWLICDPSWPHPCFNASSDQLVDNITWPSTKAYFM